MQIVSADGAILVLYFVGATGWGSKIYTLRGGLDGCEQMCTLHAVVVLWVCLRETD